MWDIAKHFYTTVEEICTLNELESDQVTPGMPLLLVKKWKDSLFFKRFRA